MYGTYIKTVYKMYGTYIKTIYKMYGTYITIKVLVNLKLLQILSAIHSPSRLFSGMLGGVGW